MIIKTLNSLINDFKSYLQAQNSKINANAPYTFWSIIAGAIGAFFLDLYANLQLVFNAVYPQTSTGSQIDLWLYSLGLPARQTPTFSKVTCNLISGSQTIAIGATFTSEETGIVWVSKQAYTIPNNTTNFDLYAQQLGSNYYENSDNTLDGATFNVKVISCEQGATEETDQSCINRILTAKRAPLSGARATDYSVYCLNYNSTLTSPIVTDSIIIPSFLIVQDVSILGISPLVGQDISYYQLDQGLLPSTTFQAYSRLADQTTLNGVTTYINSLRLVGLTPTVIGCETHIVATDASPLAVQIAMLTGYSISTIVEITSQDINYQPITINLTVAQLVERSIRKSINDQAFGATLIGGNRYITLESLITSTMNQIGVNTGQIAQILTNIIISGGDIQVPNKDESISNLFFTYDIESYDSITVTAE